MDSQAGTLYVVGTPIGNLEDMTFRAISVLRQVDAIAAEDTRHTGKLLHHFQISTPQVSYHDHNRLSRLPDLLRQLQQGRSLALVSDAGMPGISDPGYELVQACVEAGVTVVPIPGASAVITALSAAGLPTERFSFEGFLPAKGQPRQQRLEALQADPRTLVFYEAPHRLRQTLEDLQAAFGPDRPIVLARELTKRYEQFWRGTLAEAIGYYQTQEPQGEFTLVLGGQAATPLQFSESALLAELQHLINQGLSRSQASRQLAQQTALPRRQIYQLALTLAEENAEDAVAEEVVAENGSGENAKIED
jgi:16S rRNA (cytidine1402-2'-O)-methyltransferase